MVGKTGLAHPIGQDEQPPGPHDGQELGPNDGQQPGPHDEPQSEQPESHGMHGEHHMGQQHCGSFLWCLWCLWQHFSLGGVQQLMQPPLQPPHDMHGEQHMGPQQSSQQGAASFLCLQNQW
jgi:hypothetical protein